MRCVRATGPESGLGGWDARDRGGGRAPNGWTADDPNNSTACATAKPHGANRREDLPHGPFRDGPRNDPGAGHTGRACSRPDNPREATYLRDIGLREHHSAAARTPPPKLGEGSTAVARNERKAGRGRGSPPRSGGLHPTPVPFRPWYASCLPSQAHPRPRRPVIIDCHTHLNRYSPDDPPTLAERYARLGAEMTANGIAHAVVLTAFDITPDWPSPDDVLAMVAGDPRLSVVAGVSHPHLGGDQVTYLRDLLQAKRIRGLKLYPGYQPFHLTDRRLHPVYELAAEHGVPVMIHMGDTYSPGAKVRYAHPLELDDVAVDFRATTFVMCHLGNPWFADAMEVIYKNENVMGDFCGLTLGAFEPRYERLALRRVNDVVAYVNDPTKLMFGTDWPISDIASYLRFTERLEFTDAEREGVLWRNAARVFGIAVDGDGDGAEA